MHDHWNGYVNPEDSKQMRERGVPVIACEIFKQFHGFSKLVWQNWLKCFHFLTKAFALVFVTFKEPLFLTL